MYCQLSGVVFLVFEPSVVEFRPRDRHQSYGGTAVDRVPRSPMRGKCPPSTSLSQEVNDCSDDMVRGNDGLPAFCVLRISISLAAPIYVYFLSKGATDLPQFL
jgi:hypothetical protein